MKTLKSTKEYNIGWIAALSIERAAAIALFDEEHTQPLDFAQHHSGKNSYSWGRVSNHNVVVAALPAIYGITPATVAALGLVATFPHIKIGLLVGIGAGLPTPSLDIRIGDIAVSQPSGTSGGVIQYDTGKATSKGWERTGVSTLPPLILLSALGNVQARHELEDSRVQELLQDAARRNRKFSENYMRPILEDDRKSKSYTYVNMWEMELKRPRRTDKAPRIFYGNIASGNILVKDEITRKKILESIGEPCICFEMEAAGLMSSFPCLAIRGISDYADSRKDDNWQRYAAAVAAAFAKELLYYVPKFEIESIKSIAEQLGDMQSISSKLHESVQTTGKDLLTMDMERWLAAADPSHDYHQALKVRHAGSGEWFLSSSIFQEWQNRTLSVLLLYGIPGCGKTVLASIVIEHLQRVGDDTEFLLYFYLDVQDKRKQNLDDILRSLIRQMLYMAPSGVTHLEQAYKSCRQRSLDTTELNRLFLTLCEQNSVVIVLDALDECTEPDNLFDWIKNISAIDHVRLMLSARIHEDIGKLLRDWLSPRQLA